MCRLIVILLSVTMFGSMAGAADLAREQRLKEQIIDAILDGDPVMLRAYEHEFLGIYTEAGDDNNRAVIVMHGTGIHPDWQQVIQPLRVGLTEHSWNTLSIQMPILPNEAEYPEYAPLYDEVAPRINAAIQYLKDQGSKEIVLIGHSQGAAMTAYYLSTSKQTLQGFVAIGMASYAEDPRMDSISALQKIKLPVLDIYGDDDLEGILKSVDARAAAAKKAGNKNYTQLEVAGANHFFDNKEDALIAAISTWLDKSASSQ